MKKLLSLLSVLTISGTAVPTTIAASPYQKEENNKINYEQENNLKKLQRYKRQDNNIFTAKTLNFDYDVKKYFHNLCQIMNNLLENKIMLRVSDLSNESVICNSNYFAINSNSNYNYFIIPILFEGRDISLVFRTSDFYLQGFTIVTNSEVRLSLYYHFSDSTITDLGGYSSRSFGFDSNYNTLMPDADQATVRWDNNITQAFWDIINYGDNPNSRGNICVIRGALARVILVTSESIRFRKARNSIINYVQNEANWGFFHSFITRWSSITQEAINYINQYGNLNGFWGATIVLMFSSSMYTHLTSCNRRQARDLNNNEYCFSNIKKDLNLIINNYFLGYLNNNDDKTIIESVKNKNKLADIEGYTIRNKKFNSADFWIDKENNFYEQWSWQKVYFEILVNNEKPLYDKEDFFQVYYVSAGHDKIKTNLSLKTALGIEKMFYENRKTDFMIYLSNLFKKMKQKNNTGWLGSITDTDHSTLVDFIYEHYSYFHNKVLELSINKNYNTIEIETNRVGEWNPNYIYLINKK